MAAAEEQIVISDNEREFNDVLDSLLIITIPIFFRIYLLIKDLEIEQINTKTTNDRFNLTKKNIDDFKIKRLQHIEELKRHFNETTQKSGQQNEHGISRQFENMNLFCLICYLFNLDMSSDVDLIQQIHGFYLQYIYNGQYIKDELTNGHLEYLKQTCKTFLPQLKKDPKTKKLPPDYKILYQITKTNPLKSFIVHDTSFSLADESGSESERKYLKYKQKYLKLKYSISNFN